MILVIGKLNNLWYIYIKIFNKKDNKNSKKGKFDIDIMKELTDEEKKNFLKWSEGNKYLYELLCACWENGITTFASCGGHKNGYKIPYLGIIINNNSLPFIKSMLGQIQDMDNIVVTFDVRGNSQLLADEELRGILFYAHNYNCCELFYKMREGIETKERGITLSPKTSRFYDMITRLNATSREELQADVNDDIIVGSTFSTKTQDFIEFEKNKKMIRNIKIIRFFRKLLPFKKLDITRYENLQQKYGFLQREYSGKQTSKMEQYRVENFDNQEKQSNYRKKIRDIEPIESSGLVLTRDTIQEFVEEPCLDACKYLYDLNIETTMSSANKKDVGGHGYIHIALDSLSTENQQIILGMLEQDNEQDRFSLGTERGEIPKRIISIQTPINEETTVGDVRKDFMQVLSLLKMQDVLYGRYSRDEVIQYIKSCYGQDIEIDEELIKDIGFCYCSDEDIYFENEELLNKHLKYKNRESNIRSD